jgi:hypothetical protein
LAPLPTSAAFSVLPPFLPGELFAVHFLRSASPRQIQGRASVRHQLRALASGTTDDPQFGATATFSSRASTKRQCLLTTSPPTTVIARTRQPQQHLDTPYSLPYAHDAASPAHSVTLHHRRLFGLRAIRQPASARHHPSPHRRRRDAACSTALPAE